MVSLEHDNGWNSTVSINVLSILPGGQPQGTITVKLPAHSSGRDLMIAVCREAGVPVNSSYELHTCDGQFVAPDKKIINFSSILQGQALRWTILETSEKSMGKSCSPYLFIAVISFVICCAGFSAISYIYTHNPDNLQYGIIFDAGSSHTAMYIYKWEGEKINQTAVAIQDGPKCTSSGGGISSYANNTAGAGQSLVKCLNNAKERIPTKKQSSTSIYLGATAGMRLLQKENPQASEAVMESVRNMIASYPFKFTDRKKQARIILGNSEGAFSWITSNYVSGAFEEHPPTSGVVPHLIVSSLGTLDMGGASTQITFIPNITQEMPTDFQFGTSLYGRNYTLYTHSFLCYGSDQAAKRLEAVLIEAANYSSNVSNPCAPEGYVLNLTHADAFSSVCVGGEDAQLTFGHKILAPQHIDQNTEYHLHGQSDPAACKAIVAKSLFNLTAPCPYNRCSFNGVYQPPVLGQYYAISAYFYLMDFLNLTSTESYTIQYTNFSTAALSLCKKNWGEVQQMKTEVPEYLPYFCFRAIYVDTILVDGYKFDPNSTWNGINFVKSVGGVDAGWTLGFIINESNSLPAKKTSKDLTTVTFSLLAVLFSAFLLISFGFLWLARRHRARGRGLVLQNSGGYGSI